MRKSKKPTGAINVVKKGAAIKNVGFALFFWGWQFVFGIVAIVAYGSTEIFFIGTFFSLLGGKEIAIGFWALSVLIALVGYMVFLLYFLLTGVRDMRLGVAACAFTADYLFGVGAFLPGLPIWVWIVSTSNKRTNN